MFDAIVLGLFTIVGINKSMEVNLPFWVCIVMGTISGSIGGVIKAVLLNEVPLLLQKNITTLELERHLLRQFLLCLMALSVMVTQE